MLIQIIKKLKEKIAPNFLKIQQLCQCNQLDEVLQMRGELELLLTNIRELSARSSIPSLISLYLEEDIDNLESDRTLSCLTMDDKMYVMEM